MKENIILIGAGSAMFTRGLIADLIRQKWEVELALVDVDVNALAIVKKLARKMIEAKKAPITIKAISDRRKALKGATVVITTIAVGGRRSWEQDVFIPRKYGIYQPVGDSVMPGGTSRALRMIPAMVDIARDVLDLAPNALFFNYSNPMSVICRAVRKATGARIIGLCHGVFHTSNYLAGVLGVSPRDLKYTAVGMNHLTWFTELRIKGRNVLLQLLEIAKRRVAENANLNPASAGFSEGCEGGDQDPFPASWEICRLFGGFPAVLDRHITEFFPSMFCGKDRYYGKTLGLDAYRFEDCIAYGDQIFAEMKAGAFSSKTLGSSFFNRLSGEHEQVTDIIASIRQDSARVFSANLPNRGQIPNLPADAVVEGPSVADGGGLHPIQQAPLNAAMAGTLASRWQWVETTVEAALEGNREKLVQALFLDGAVDSVTTAWRLADEFLQVHAPYLPQFK